MTPCICCGEPEKFSIRLAVGPTFKSDIDRYYIPNKAVRDAIAGAAPDPTELIPFCADCMRTVEDNLRATIMYLQFENERLKVVQAVQPTYGKDE